MSLLDWLRGRSKHDDPQEDSVTADDRHARAAALAARVNAARREPVTAAADLAGPIYLDLPEGHARRLPEGGPPLHPAWTPPDVPLHKTVRPEDRPQPQTEPPPRPRPSKVNVNVPARLNKPAGEPAREPTGAQPPQESTPQPAARTVDKRRGVELARELRARGVESAKWTREPHSDRWELTVDEGDEAHAGRLLEAMAREQASGTRP